MGKRKKRGSKVPKLSDGRKMLAVPTPRYDELFVVLARELRGRWERGKWWFAPEAHQAALEAAGRIFPELLSTVEDGPTVCKDSPSQ